MVRVVGGLRSLKANLVSGRVKPIGNWLYRAVEATTSASIRWIRLIICIRKKSVSWVLMYCLRVITCLVDVCIFSYMKCMKWHDKSFSTLDYHFCLFVCSVHGFLFLWWSSIYWCEHMRELLVVIRVMEVSLLSSSWFRILSFLSSLLGL